MRPPSHHGLGAAAASSSPMSSGTDSDEDAGLNSIIDDMYNCVEWDDVVDKETVCPGQKYTRNQAKEISRKWLATYIRRNAEHRKACEEFVASGDDSAQFPPYPLRLLPKTSYHCIKKSIYCDHHEYLTFNTSETASTIGKNEPSEMLQIFSLKLSSYESYPISVYGIFAVRDELDKLRNYVFNRTRDNPVVIEKDSITLPLCSPCRGMHVLSYALFEVDLWVKVELEGGGSDDKQLLSEYAEIMNNDMQRPMITGRIPSDNCLLDVDYMLLFNSVEAVIQVFIKDDSDNPHHVRFTAFSSGFDHEIMLFDDRLCKKGKLFQHVVAVKSKEKLVICLEFEGSMFRWTFQDGDVAAVSSPDDSVSKLFDVVVLFSPKS